MTKPMFKPGDRVRRVSTSDLIVSNCPEKLQYRIGFEGVVKTVSGNTLILEGFTGGLSANRFELVSRHEPTQEEIDADKTDKELVDEYREVYSRMRALKLILISRGYKQQWKSDEAKVYVWTDFKVHRKTSDDIRWVKFETVTEMMPVTKTVEVVL